MPDLHLPIGTPAWHWMVAAINGSLSAVCFFGALAQWLEIRRRRRLPNLGPGAELATAVLSTRQFASSFFGAFGTFVFAYTAPVFEHALVWPRLASALAYIAILWEIHRDRRQVSTARWACGLTLMLAASLCSLPWSARLGPMLQSASAAVLLLVAAALAAGYSDQMRRVWRSGSTGALSKPMLQFILAMDVSTLALGASMGLRSSWPIVVVASVSLVTKVVMLGLFRWVRRSRLAQLRRGPALPAA